MPATSGSTPKLRRLEERRPRRPGQEVGDRDLLEELERGHEERDHDPDRRRDRDQRAHEEDALDDVLPDPAALGAEPRLRARRHVSRGQLRAHRCLEIGVRLLDLLVGQRDELRRLRDLGLVVDQVADERLDLGALERLLLRVDEERPRERLVGSVLRVLDARRDAAVAAVDLDRLQRVLVLLVVGEAEVAEAALLAGDAGDGVVVVLARGVVGAARALLAVDLVREVVERARVGAGAEERQLLVRERVGSTSFQFFTFESGPQIVASCSTVRQVAQSFSLLTTTVSASFATWNSTYSIPASLQIVASSSLIAREAFERSVSPRQKRSKPPPVPETPTVTWTSGFSFWKRSAAAVVNGPTVLEPSASIRPDRSLPPVRTRSSCRTPRRRRRRDPRRHSRRAGREARAGAQFSSSFLSCSSYGESCCRPPASGLPAGEDPVKGW